MVKVATCIRKKSQVLTKNFWLFLYLVQFESNTVCYEIFKVRKGYFCFQFILILFLCLVAGQQYNAYCAPEEIISGNDAILKCSIPSFVSDFVAISSWVDSEGREYFSGQNNGKL